MQQGRARRRRPARSLPRRLQVFLVEDDPATTTFIRDALAGTADTHAVSTVDEAIRLLATVPRRRLDIGIVDCPLPAPDRPDATTAPTGVALVAAIHEARPQLPIIVITAATNVESLMLASFRGGARDFLRKPFTADQLREAIARVAPAPPKDAPSRGRAATAVARVVTFLDAHAGQSVSLKTLARVAGMSRSHLSRSFHAIVGTLLRSYIRDLRLKRAERLLLGSPTVPLTRVAARAGYYDLPHFDKEFRRRFGMSPSEFRHRKDPAVAPRRRSRRRSA
jgi:AraC-like DNA-binding protein